MGILRSVGKGASQPHNQVQSAYVEILLRSKNLGSPAETTPCTVDELT
jgi:hypothetical protein